MASGLRGGVVRPRTWSSASSQGSPVRLWWDEKPEDSPPWEGALQRAGRTQASEEGREKGGKQSDLTRKPGYSCFNKPLVCCDFTQLKLG